MIALRPAGTPQSLVLAGRLGALAACDTDSEHRVSVARENELRDAALAAYRAEIAAAKLSVAVEAVSKWQADLDAREARCREAVALVNQARSLQPADCYPRSLLDRAIALLAPEAGQ